MPNIIETTDAAAGASTIYTLQIGQVAQGNISSLGDHDFYRVNLVAGQTYSVALVGTGTAGVRDSYLRIYGSDGTLITQDDDGLPNNNSVRTFTASTSGTYYIDAAAFNDAGTGQYGVSIATGTRATTDVQMGAGIIDAYSATGNNEYSWSGTPGTGATVTVGFRLTDDGAEQNFFQFTPQQMAAAQTILQYYSSVCGINFTVVNPGGYTDNASILLSTYNVSDNSGGYGGYPGSTLATSTAGDIHINIAGGNSTSSLPLGSYSFYTLMHEMGHAVGLSHPGLYNAAPGVSPTYGANAAFVQDTQQYTVMSYFDESNTTGSWSEYPQTLMMYDIYALQQMYGANYSTRSGNSVYGFNSNVGGVYDFSSNSRPALCIWDGGGTDTLDCSGFSQSQIISLIDGTFSNVGGLTGNVSIALNAIIESAIGGSGIDTLIANNSGCSLSGRGSGDTLIGGTGNDRLIGGTGRDTMTGSGGFDTFVFASGDSLATAGQHDLVTDFTSDFIDISSMGTFRFLGTAAFDGGTFALDYFYNSGTGVTTVQGDLNGDRVADFAIDLTGNIALNAGNFIGAYSAANGVTKHDFKGDGSDDILVQNNGAISFANMQQGVFKGWQTVANVPGYSVVGSGDVNHDGFADVVVQNGAGQIVYANMANGAFSGWSTVGNVPGWTARDVGDINHDGNCDVVIQNNSSGEIQYADMHNGVFSGWHGVAGAPGYTVRGVADVNGDGYEDIVVQTGSNQISYANMANGNFTNWVNVGNAPGYSVVGVGDINGDGNADVVVQNSSGQIIYANMHNGVFSGWGMVANTPGWTAKSVEDVVDDGYSDVVIQNASGQIQVANMNGGAFSGWINVATAPGYTVSRGPVASSSAAESAAVEKSSGAGFDNFVFVNTDASGFDRGLSHIATAIDVPHVIETVLADIGALLNSVAQGVCENEPAAGNAVWDAILNAASHYHTNDFHIA